MSQSSLINWPSGWDRTPDWKRDDGAKFQADYQQTRRELRAELENRMGVENWRIDDESGRGGDPGVVLRWMKDDQEHAVACDAYKHKRANIRAIYLWVVETRKSGDRPVKTGHDQFAAARLPPGDEERAKVVGRQPPHDVLGVSPDAPESVVKAAARRLSADVHPDKENGDEDEFKRIQKAKEAMLNG